MRSSTAAPAPPASALAQPQGEQSHIAPLPRHLAVIMDGNGRWAQQRGLSRHQGHRAGSENIRTVIEAAAERGIEYLTLYAFSTENWSRSKREVDGLLRILTRFFNRELRQLHENGVRLVHLGRLDTLSPRLQRQVTDAIELTKDNTRITVAVAFNYGSRAEIVHALQRIVADGVPADAIDERTVSSYLYTAGMPDPDLIIRTGGEVRLSNFLLWQAAYAELYSTMTYWPDFGRAEMDAALLDFARRERRFGAVPEKNGGRSSGAGRRT